MKILEPTSNAPVSSKQNSKHIELYLRISTLKEGEWLPVECEDSKERERIRASVSMKKEFRSRIVTRSVGLTMYITLLPAMPDHRNSE